MFTAVVLSGCAGLANTTNSATPQAAVQIAPANMTFPEVAVGQQATQTAVLTNTGSEAISITQLAASSPEFTTSGLTFPLNLGPGQSAMFKVAFRTSTAGTVSGVLSAMTSRGGGSTKVKLNGNSGKTPSQLSLSSSNLKYGNVLVNGSATQAVTLKNNGTSDVNISQLSVSGSGFSVGGVTVPATIPAGQSASLQATFAPTTAGSVSGSVTITSDATTPTSTVGLSGTGMSASYTMSLSPATVSFGNVNAGGSASQTVTLSNTGNSSVTVTSVTASGTGVSVSGVTAPVTLAPSQSVPLTVNVAPSAAGAISGSLTVTNNDGINASAAVTGTGIQAALGVSPAAASFGNVNTGSSATQAILLKNTGTANLTVSGAAISGSGFTASGLTFPLTLTPGQSGTLNVKYAPTTTGPGTGSLSIASSAPNSPAVVALSGNGATAPTYTMLLAPATLSFGNVNSGSSAAQTVTLTNTGNSSVTISQVSASGNGVTVSGLSAGATLAPSQSVPLSVTFAPTTGGAITGGVSVSNSQGGSASAAVTGSGVVSTHSMSLAPSTLTFGNVNSGSSATQTVTLSNTGNSSITISQVSASGNGVTVSGLATGVTLAPSQSVPLSVTFAPNIGGAITGGVSVANSQGGSASAAVTGSGVASTYTMTLSPSTVAFGNINTGSTAAQTVTLTNTGNSAITISQISAAGTGVSVSGLAAGQTVAPSQSVTLSVTYSPTAKGAITGGSVSVTNSQSVSVSSAVTGSGVQAGISITPSSASFGSVVTGNTNSQTIQVSNSGTANLTISQATVTGSGFSLNGLSLPLTLTPSQSTSFNLQFAPTAAGAVSGSLSITSNAPGSPAGVSLSGTGVAATNTLSVSPGSLSFGSVSDGSSASQSITVTNTGNSNVAISGVSITGTGFSILSGSGAVTLSPTQSTSVGVQFAPTAAGAASGNVSIASNASGSPANVTLSGTGSAPVSHSVGLAWGASTSTVAGYNVYRSTVSGSSYVKLNGSLVSSLNYSDSSVNSGTTYYYVATSVDSSGNESVYSNEVSSTVP